MENVSRHNLRDEVAELRFYYSEQELGGRIKS
jgi:hypothetical protein